MPGIEGLRHSAEDAFERARQVLLPNEESHLACQTLKGFLVVTSRRLVQLHEDVQQGYRITKTLPFDYVSNLESITENFDIKEPRRMSGESKAEAREYFQTTISRCIEIVDELRSPERKGVELTSRNLSYLQDIPKSLTQDAILDLNAVLDDRPVHDELVTLALDFLGTEIFLIEESLRDTSDKENGVLFAAGKKGYYWIRGKKQGRFLSNVVVDTVEWNNIRTFGQRWEHKHPIISVTYSLVDGGKPITMDYQWVPPINSDTLQYPWIVQPHNGPYILEDIVYKFSGRAMTPSI